MRKEVSESEGVFDGLPGSLAVEGTGGVGCVAHDADCAAVVLGDVGEVPDCPCGGVFEEL